MKESKFDEFERHMIQKGLLGKGSAKSYKSYLNEIDKIIDGSLETLNFLQNEKYLDEITQFLSEIKLPKKKLSKIKSALYKFADFAMTKHSLPGEIIPKNFPTEWLKYVASTEAIKRAMNCTANVTGDFGEFLIADVFGYTKARNSEKTIDLKDKAGKTYQIKTRKVQADNTTTSLGICRSLKFDYLISILLAPNGAVLKILKHRRKKLADFIPKSKNVHQGGYVFVTTQEFQKAGENSEMLAAVLKKYPELQPQT